MTGRLKSRLTTIIGIIILLLILFGILSAIYHTNDMTTRQKNVFHDAMFGDSACHLPCWQGITPGITTRSQALAILESSQFVRKGSIVQSDLGNNIGGCMWEWKKGETMIQSGLSWKKEIVDVINIGIPIDMKVEEIISKFDTPELLIAVNGGTPEHWNWYINLYYPQSGMQFTAITSEYVSAFDSSTSIEGVDLYPPTTLDQRLSQEYRGVTKEELLKNSKPWKGYGDLIKFYGFQGY